MYVFMYVCMYIDGFSSSQRARLVSFPAGASLGRTRVFPTVSPRPSLVSFSSSSSSPFCALATLFPQSRLAPSSLLSLRAFLFFYLQLAHSFAFALRWAVVRKMKRDKSRQRRGEREREFSLHGCSIARRPRRAVSENRAREDTLTQLKFYSVCALRDAHSSVFILVEYSLAQKL